MPTIEYGWMGHLKDWQTLQSLRRAGNQHSEGLKSTRIFYVPC
jgi:hypothetical protein